MIIATTGPNLFKTGIVKELCKLGLDAIRIPSSKQPPLEQLGKIIPELDGNVKVIVDFPGGKHRLNNPGDFQILKGETLKINKIEAIYDFSGVLSIYPAINGQISAGDILIIGDGESALSVIDDNAQELVVKVERDAVLGPRRGIALKNKNITNEILTANDYVNMKCLTEKIITGVMLSFVEQAQQIEIVRKYILKNYAREVVIYAKIETEKGIDNIEEIAAKADYVVLARGDLLITAGEEYFPVLQEKFLDKMRSACGKAIIATELAHSVGQGYLMSRSELTFLYILGQMGYKNLMLASETTVHCDPVEVFEKVKRLINYYSSI